MLWVMAPRGFVHTHVTVACGASDGSNLNRIRARVSIVPVIIKTVKGIPRIFLLDRARFLDLHASSFAVCRGRLDGILQLALNDSLAFAPTGENSPANFNWISQFVPQSCSSSARWNRKKWMIVNVSTVNHVMAKFS